MINLTEVEVPLVIYALLSCLRHKTEQVVGQIFFYNKYYMYVSL